ncbi:MAG TPA: hypothetical protein VH092_18250 [Urbifossiella sp.]|jgi:hypothetical protein|nr:hypothetical protein [Urbifossiella sp.]
MRSDFRALFRIIGASFVVAFLVMGVLVAAAVGVLSREVAAGVALFGIVAGGIVVGRTFSRGLMSRERPDPKASSGAARRKPGGEGTAP